MIRTKCFKSGLDQIRTENKISRLIKGNHYIGAVR